MDRPLLLTSGWLIFGIDLPRFESGTNDRLYVFVGIFGLELRFVSLLVNRLLFFVVWSFSCLSLSNISRLVVFRLKSIEELADSALDVGLGLDGDLLFGFTLDFIIVY